MDRALWIDRFVMEMSSVGSNAPFDSLTDVAESYVADYGMCDPSVIARKRVEQFGLPGEEPSIDEICTMFGVNGPALSGLLIE